MRDWDNWHARLTIGARPILSGMALPTRMTLRQQTVADIPAIVGLVDETWSALYGLTGYFTVDGLELGLNRPQRDPERGHRPALRRHDQLLRTHVAQN